MAPTIVANSANMDERISRIEHKTWLVRRAIKRFCYEYPQYHPRNRTIPIEELERIKRMRYEEKNPPKMSDKDKLKSLLKKK